MSKVLILLGSHNDAPVTEKGVGILKEFGVPFELRVASAHRTPSHVEALVENFEKNGGEVVMCGAGMSAHLAGVVASLTTLPVLAVPIASKGAATAGFDSLLSMCQMPGGIPVATMSFGKAGFVNGALFAVQMMGLKDQALAAKFKDYRKSMSEAVLAADAEHKIVFEG